MTIPDEFVVKSAAKLSTKNAWALYVRRRWPQNTVKSAMAEWDLTDGEARGLVFAQISHNTEDKIFDHPRGGMGLALKITEIRFQTGLRAWVQSQKERSADAARRHEEDAAALGEMAGRLPAALGLVPAGVRGVGVRRPRERRSFRS